MGCETCTDETQYACLTCSEGFFSLNNGCSSGCPPDMYTNTETKACQQCHPNCMTCSQPNEYSCTACPTGFYLFDGACATSCPITHYQGFLGELGVAQIPACVPKLVLNFTLSLTTSSRVINMKFNYGIVYLILAISQRIQIEISNTQIDHAFFVLSPLAESTIEFQYLGDQYFPPDSILKITIDLDSGFNSDTYTKFLIYEKTQTIKLKEIYPFTKTEKQVISSTSELTSSGGNTIATVQAVSSVAQGAASLSLIRMQMVGEIVQMMRLIDIRWPANIAEYFQTSHIDPSSIVIPIDFTTIWNDHLGDRNYSIPRIFESYEISPFITVNYGIELSNLILWAAIAISGVLLIRVLKKALRKLTEKIPLPKTNARGKHKYCCVRAIHSLARFMNRRDESMLWNLLLMFFLSIFMSGTLWALLNIRYYSELLEPSTFYTTATFVVAIIFLCFYLLLAAFITKMVWNQLQYVLGIKESLRPLHLKKYRGLFDDFECEKSAQVFYVPISLLRSIIFVMVVLLLCPHGTIQIILIWVADLAFIVYLIVYHPLKEKWVRRITLVIEILVFGCNTLGFIFGFLEEVDAVTLVELGFAFLALSMASTFAGILISLLQVLEVGKLVARFIMEKLKNRRNVVHPISLSEIPRKDPKSIENHERVKVLDLNHEESTPTNNHLDKPTRYDSLLKKLSSIPPNAFKEASHGEEYLDKLEGWIDSFCSETNIKIDNSTHMGTGTRKNAGSSDRITLFSSNM